MKKRILVLFLAGCVTFSAIPFPAYASETIVSEDETVKLADSTKEYELIIEDGVVTGYTGTPVNVTITDGVTSIGYGAFLGCSSLKSVSIPKGVTSIGYSAFWNCSSLKSISIPSSVTSIGANAFYGTAWLSAQQKKNPLVVVNHILIDGRTCTGTVTIPDGVTSIVDYAFYESKLSSVSIPKGVTSIGNGAFWNCSSLKSISIPSSVTSIGGNAFYGTAWLSAQQKKNPLVVVNHILIDGSTCTGKVTIPDGVTSIGGNAFHESALTSVSIPKSVTSIGGGAFSSCGCLKSVKIPSSVTTIGDNVFGLCSALTSIQIPSSVTSIGNGAFYHTGLTSVSIPSGVTSIGAEAFMECGSLTSITIPDGVTSIESNTFLCCSSLTNVTIPSSVTSIEDMAFSGSDKLTIYGVSGSTAQTYAKQNDIPFAKAYNITFKANGGTNLSESVRCVKADEKLGTLPTVEREGYTFKGWYTEKTGGTKVTKSTQITAKTTLYAQWEKITTSIKKANVTLSKDSYAYNGKERKPSVTITLGDVTLKKGTDYTVTYSNNKNIGTATVTIKGKGNYSGTISKKFKITLEKGKTFTSGKYKYKVTGSSTVAFNGIANSDTKKVSIPKEVTYGGKNFKVTSISANALKNKTKVTSVTIGENVKTIGKSAFEGCKNLKTITIKSTQLKTVGKNALKGISDKAKIKVPSKSLKSYKKLLKGKGQGGKVTITKA